MNVLRYAWNPSVVLSGAVALLFLVAATAAPAGAQEEPQARDEIEVAEAILTTAVEDRQPVDTLTTVPADVERVYLWTRVVGAEEDTQVVHIWYRGDEETARVALDIRGPDWRTWSSKAILPGWTGEWRVEIVDADGNPLETHGFTVE